MADQQLIKLLEEIRDLQKQQIENSRQAIANQHQAIETQKQAVRRGRTALILVGVIVLAIYFLPIFWWTLGWGFRCSPRH
jgi:CHASE3 domain sensor protein